MTEWSYIWAAYGLTWLVLVGYSVYLVSRVRGARKRLEGVINSEVGG